MKAEVNFDFLLEELSATKTANAPKNTRIANLAMTALDTGEANSLLMKIANDTFSVSQQLVPVKTGALKNSGNINWYFGKLTINYNTSYAAYVHEIIDNRHLAPTQAKFLQDAFAMVMLNLVHTYGASNIPDFNVRLEISVDDGVSLVLAWIPELIGSKSETWRRFLGL